MVVGDKWKLSKNKRFRKPLKNFNPAYLTNLVVNAV